MREGVRVLVVGLVCALLTSACLENPAVTCKNGQICAPGNFCDDAHGGCATSSQIVACSGKSEEAACSYPGTTDGACYEGVCLPSGCGNGVMADDEVCDDGNRMHGDGCSADCRSTEICGNGIVDKFTTQPEECDDGNSVDGDSCHANCTQPVCGDGIKDPQFNEACDMGGANSDAANAACRKNCQPKRCGDGIEDNGEVCDDGNIVSGDGCSGDCQSKGTCGNDYVDVADGEECDDGDTIDGPGCRGNCTVPVCGDGILDTFAFEQCDDGTNNSDSISDACRTNCQRSFCGDGIPDSDEVCDDGNTTFGDRCFYNCQSDETCGNGFVDFFWGEECDDDDALSHDGCGHCQTEVPVWAPAGPGLPPARREGAMVYDAARGRVLLVGGDGFGSGNTYRNDTWSWNGSVWTNVTPALGLPPARYEHGAAYDAARDRVVLFGGYAGVAVNDTWEWNGTSWTSVTPASASPRPRTNPAMAYDAARGRVVLFGGWGDDGLRLNDTWEWNGSVWNNVTPAGSPSIREDSAMAYDPVRGRVVLFGGYSGTTSLGDTWQWNGSAWTQVTPTSGSPPAQSGATMAFDATRGRIVMFGGGQTWELNGSTWTNVTPAGSPSSGEMTYDAARGRAVLFRDTSGVAETWEWNGSSWTKVTPGSGAPSARGMSGIAYDSARAKVVLFGGYYWNSSSSTALDDTWEWNGSSWTNVTPASGSPSMRSEHAMAYDAARGRVVMFGGYGAMGGLGDTWEWDGSSWRQPTYAPAFTNASFETPAVGAASFQYVPTGATWTFSGGAGIQSNGSSWGAASAPDGTQTAFLQGAACSLSQTITLQAGTYALKFQWAQRSTQNQPLRLRVDGVAVGTPTAPSSSNFSSFTTAHFTVADGTHTIALECSNPNGDNSTFVDAISIVSAPPARYWHSMAYDAVRQRVVLFGGTASDFVTTQSDTWEWNGSTWLDVTPTSGSPSPRQSHAMAYDVARGRVVLFGGYYHNASPFPGVQTYFNDTWEWTGSAWLNVTPNAGSPPVREEHAMAYDVSRRRVVMFGGYNGGFVAGDTWEWDGSTWSYVTAASGSPPPRIFGAMAYDAARSRTVLFGGDNDTSSIGDTWTFAYQGSNVPDEGCRFGRDGDDDGLVGCADPDCFGYCTPMCNPTTMTCSSSWQYCGDGTCQSVESKRLCPADCGAPTAICGDLVCQSPETTQSCPGDCSPAPATLAPMVGDLAINEFMAADNVSDTNCDGSTANTHDEFVEVVNISNKTLDLNGVTVADGASIRHTFSSTILPPGEAVILWSGGVPAIKGACANVKRAAVASSGQLGLNDSGDTITLALGGTQLVTVTYGQATTNKSFNLSPELMPNNAATPTNYVLHDTVAGAQGTYSPGTRSSGASF